MRNPLSSIILLMLSPLALANTSAVVTVEGVLHMPTICALSQPADIDMGDILTTDINGSSHAQDLGITLTCQNRNPLQSVNIQVSSIGGVGNRVPLSPQPNSAEGFELALKKGSVDQNLDTDVRVDTDGDLNLSLTPVVKAGEAFKAGPFKATVTVVVTVV